MSIKSKILWCLAAIAFICGSPSIYLQYWIHHAVEDKRREFVETAAGALLERGCAIPKDRNCDFIKRLSASVVERLIHDNLGDALKYAPSSGKYLHEEYSEASDVIETLQKGERDEVKVLNRLINGHASLQNSPKFETEDFISVVRYFDEKRDKYSGISELLSVPAICAGLLLVLVGLWELFLAMIRSLRRAWMNPNE